MCILLCSISARQLARLDQNKQLARLDRDKERTARGTLRALKAGAGAVSFDGGELAVAAGTRIELRNGCTGLKVPCPQP